MISTLSTPSENNNQEKYKDNASVAQAYSRMYQKGSSVLKKSLSDWSVVQNRIKHYLKESETPQKTGFSAP